MIELSSHLKLSATAFEKDYRAYQSRQSRTQANRPSLPSSDRPNPPQPPVTTHTPERDLLMLCLHFDSLGKPLSTSLPHEWINASQPAGILLNRFLAEFEHDTWPGRDHLDALLETPEERTLVASLIFETPAIDDPVKVANEGMRQLRARALEPRLRQIELALANTHADSKSDPISLLKARSEIQRQLRQPLGLSLAV
jgi:DNA primase